MKKCVCGTGEANGGEQNNVASFNLGLFWAGCRVGRDASDGRRGSKGPTRECPRFRLGIPLSKSCLGGVGEGLCLGKRSGGLQERENKVGGWGGEAPQSGGGRPWI
jgi:hypothetical protein